MEISHLLFRACSGCGVTFSAWIFWIHDAMVVWHISFQNGKPFDDFLGFRHKIIDSRNDEQWWCSSQPVFRQLHSQSGHLETFRIDQPFELMMKLILNNVEIILVGCPSPDIALKELVMQTLLGNVKRKGLPGTMELTYSTLQLGNRKIMVQSPKYL